MFTTNPAQKIKFRSWMTTRSKTGLLENYHKNTYRWTSGFRGLARLASSFSIKELDYSPVVCWGWRAEELKEIFCADDSLLLSPYSVELNKKNLFRCLAILSARSTTSRFAVFYDQILKFCVRRIFRKYIEKNWIFLTYEDTQPITLGVLMHVKSVGSCCVVTMQHGIFNITNDSIEGMNSDACIVYDKNSENLLRKAGFDRRILIGNPFPFLPSERIRKNLILLVGPGSKNISNLTRRRREFLFRVGQYVSQKQLGFYVLYRPHPSELNDSCKLPVELLPKHELMSNPPEFAIGFNSTLLYELEMRGSKIINLSIEKDESDSVILELIERRVSGRTDSDTCYESGNSCQAALAELIDILERQK